jgi:hypothetical protein
MIFCVNDGKNEKKKIAYFHVLGLYMAKKHDLIEKKIRLYRKYSEF